MKAFNVVRQQVYQWVLIIYYKQAARYQPWLEV